MIVMVAAGCGGGFRVAPAAVLSLRHAGSGPSGTPLPAAGPTSTAPVQSVATPTSSLDRIAGLPHMAAQAEPADIPAAVVAVTSPTSAPAATAVASLAQAATATPRPAAAATVPATATTAPPTVTAVPAAPTSLPAPQVTGRVNVNVRSGPGTLYPVIGGLAAGESQAVMARSPDGAWLEITLGDNALTPTGWVRADLMDLTGATDKIGIAQHVPPPPPPTATRPIPTAAPAVPADPAIADLIGRINKARVDAGLNQLAWSPELGQAASAHVNDMAAHNFFSHTGSDGSDVTVRMQRAGYKPVYWGEILTHVNGGPDAAFGQFWGSPHHHDILMGDKFRDIGAAWIRDPADGQFNYFAVVFGRR